jgi:dihydrolipoamide dehydrogenase
MAETCDVVVVGGGPVGEVAAGRVVAAGLSAALVEGELFGGECSYWACMPSKALLRPGHALAAAKRVPGAGVTGALDARKVLARRDSFTSHWHDDGQAEWVSGAGITALRGHGRISGERTVRVGDRELTAGAAVVLATGSVPVRPPLPGLDQLPAASVWSSRDATSSSEVPESLVVLGGGVVGVEMAQAWARLGSAVTLVVRDDVVLKRFEPFVGEFVAAGLREDGVRLLVSTEAESVARQGKDVQVTLTGGEKVTASRLLLATGRRPATDAIGLDKVGLTAPIEVDDTGLVSDVDGQWLYAIGDVAGRAPLTHQGKYEARIVADAIAARAKGETLDTTRWGKHVTTADGDAVPQVVFTDPEVAAVGRTLAAARRDGIVCDLAEVDIAVAGSSLQADGYRGRARLVIDTERKVLVGGTFVGQDVAELVHAATIAVVGEVPLSRLWHAVPAYPTISEVWLRLLETYGL